MRRKDKVVSGRRRRRRRRGNKRGKEREAEVGGIVVVCVGIAGKKEGVNAREKEIFDGEPGEKGIVMKEEMTEREI